MSLDIVKIKIKDINLAGYNPRKIRDEEYEHLENSLSEFGLVDPIIVNLKNNNIIGGHQRYNILFNEDCEQELYLLKLGDIGWVFKDLSLEIKDEAHEKALNLALNRIKGEFDVVKLNPILEELSDMNLDNLTGFDIQFEDVDYDIFDDEEDEEDEEYYGDDYNKIFTSNDYYEYDMGDEVTSQDYNYNEEYDDYDDEVIEEDDSHFVSKGDVYRIYNNILIYGDDSKEYEQKVLGYPKEEFLEINNLKRDEFLKIPINYYIITSLDLIENLIKKHINFTEKLS